MLLFSVARDAARMFPGRHVKVGEPGSPRGLHLWLAPASNAVLVVGSDGPWLLSRALPQQQRIQIPPAVH
jgi:hypothetical protein